MALERQSSRGCTQAPLCKQQGNRVPAVRLALSPPLLPAPWQAGSMCPTEQVGGQKQYGQMPAGRRPQRRRPGAVSHEVYAILCNRLALNQSRLHPAKQDCKRQSSVQSDACRAGNQQLPLAVGVHLPGAVHVAPRLEAIGEEGCKGARRVLAFSCWLDCYALWQRAAALALHCAD